MSRTIRTLAACTAALTLLAASGSAAQSTDSTRSAPPQPRRGIGGPGGGMRGEFGPREGRGPGWEMGGRRGGRGGFGPRSGPGAPGRGAMMQSPRGGALMRGITLSADQEKALRSAQARHILATKPLMVEMMSARMDEQLARANGDQKGLDAATARIAAARTKLDTLRSQRSPTSDLRAVLTPDQQKILDKNLIERGAANRGGRRGALGPGRNGPGAGRAFRDGGTAPRGPRQAPRMRRWTEDAGASASDTLQ